MAISDRIKEALEKIIGNDQINALIQISIAIDSSGKKMFPGIGSKSRCKKFITENIAFITRSAFGKLEIQNSMTFLLGSDGDPKTLEDTLYELVRCNLIHEGELSEKVEITNENLIGVTEEGKFILSTKLIFGLLLAVIASPVNKDESVSVPYVFNLTTCASCYD